jgi:hypothetical protein
VPARHAATNHYDLAAENAHDSGNPTHSNGQTPRDHSAAELRGIEREISPASVVRQDSSARAHDASWNDGIVSVGVDDPDAVHRDEEMTKEIKWGLQPDRHWDSLRSNYQHPDEGPSDEDNCWREERPEESEYGEHDPTAHLRRLLLSPLEPKCQHPILSGVALNSALKKKNISMRLYGDSAPHTL